MEKPADCCEMGTYTHQIPMPIAGRVRYIDFCIADVVAALNAASIVTTWSCCGHGKIPPVVGLDDGRHLLVVNREQLDTCLNTLAANPETIRPNEGKPD